jgi:hypothetical protein
VALARKQFARPCEIFASKPHYSATTTGDSASPPEYLETHYFGNSFQMGSLTGGTSTDGGDVNGFKILCYSAQRGANALQVAPGPDPSFIGSPKYEKGKSSGPNRVAQLENTALWLVQNGKSPWTWVIPNEIRFETAGDIAYLIADRTWVAIRGLGTGPLAIDEELTRQIAEGEKPRFAGHRVLRAVGSSERYCGLAIEVGERESYGSFEEFKKHCAAVEPDLSKLQEGIVQYKSGARQLGLHWNDHPKDLGIWRNRARHDAKIHASHLYGPAATDRPSPIESPRGSGTLRVEAGGQLFTSTVADDGAATFANTPSKTDSR